MSCRDTKIWGILTDLRNACIDDKPCDKIIIQLMDIILDKYPDTIAFKVSKNSSKINIFIGDTESKIYYRPIIQYRRKDGNILILLKLECRISDRHERYTIILNHNQYKEIYDKMFTIVSEFSISRLNLIISD